tara:strand:- start:1217 stop:1774 length:558 start_codon:yes stop_codon:yes gene_type:complete
VTTLACADAAVGANESLAPEAVAALDEGALAAAADWEEVLCGVLRAAFIPDACCATDWVDAGCICWLFSARAWPDSTRALEDEETVGVKLLVAPAAAGALGELAPAAAADWASVFCGVLRAAALAPELDWAADWDEAAAMGVSRMEDRISWLICCTAEASPSSASVSTLRVPPVRLVPMMVQFFS